RSFPTRRSSDLKELLSNFIVELGSGRSNLRKIKWSLVDPHDLGALETKAGHQTLLIECEGINAAMHGVGGEAASHSFVHDDDAGAGADLPAACVVYPIHRVLVH